jgi:hypothetical protein
MVDLKLNSEKREAVANHVLQILQSLALDSDAEAITGETALGDIGLDSVSIAYLIGEIQQSYGLRDALYRALLGGANPPPIVNLRVSHLIDSIYETLTETGISE